MTEPSDEADSGKQERVVEVCHRRFHKTRFGTERDLCREVTDRRGDRCADDRVQEMTEWIAGQDQNGTLLVARYIGEPDLPASRCRWVHSVAPYSDS